MANTQLDKLPSHVVHPIDSFFRSVIGGRQNWQDVHALDLFSPTNLPQEVDHETAVEKLSWAAAVASLPAGKVNQAMTGFLFKPGTERPLLLMNFEQSMHARIRLGLLVSASLFSVRSTPYSVHKYVSLA
ncbi:conserved hypothetical protein [Coccidioides posadasii str. Silveira]|uniref:Uncharacterized protein n=1 Tax=Coccidioides posadasii (strain RMSCC 757 / Silveira) TaxID=443226 RepID=E9D1L8_COCPS|nr:conserved hypothetical protein [Coccidioides posadasii str. Silveira]